MHILIPVITAFAALVFPTSVTSMNAVSTPEEPPSIAAVVNAPAHKTYEVSVSAYSSSVDETDSTPFITAWGTRTRDGVIAANFLPLGTKVQLPELYGDKIFTVEDRMNRRFSDSVDVWMPSKSNAIVFGRQTSRIVVLN